MLFIKKFFKPNIKNINIGKEMTRTSRCLYTIFSKYLTLPI